MRILSIVILSLLLGIHCAAPTPKEATNTEDEWRLMDMGPFTLEVPPGFEYEELQGMDSYVGILRMDSIQINFDYGWYSHAGPPTALDDWMRRGDLRGWSPLRDSLAAIHPERVLPNSLILTLPIRLVSTRVEGSDTTYLVSYGGSAQVATIELTPKQLEDPNFGGKGYRIHYDFDGCSYRKQYVSNSGSNDAGLLLFKNCDHLGNRGMLNQLGLSVRGFNKSELPVVERILAGVQLVE